VIAATALLATAAALTVRDARAIERRIDDLARAGSWNEVRATAEEVAGADPELRRPVLRRAARELCAGPGCAAATGILQEAIALGGDDPELEMLRAFDAAERGAVLESLARLERYLTSRPKSESGAIALRVVSDALVHRGGRWPDEPAFEGWSVSRLPAPESPSPEDNDPWQARIREQGWTFPELLNKVEPRHPKEGPTSAAGSPRVVLDCAILRTGHVVPVRELASAGRAYTQATLEAVQRWRYRPARRNGEVVALRYSVSLRFLP
jgi:hypothetical protein